MATEGRPTVFFGYPSRPAMHADTVKAAYLQLEEDMAITARPWESLRVAGRYLIDVILNEIGESDLAAFDVTHLNHNVMFELGFAIGAQRRIWLFRDPTLVEGQRTWDRVRLLTTIGYSSYVNSRELVQEYYKQQPAHAAETVFAASIEGSLEKSGPPGLLYLRGMYETDAERLVYRRIRQESQSGLKLVVVDPSESTINPLAWYAQNIFGADAVVVHLTSAVRVDAEIHNARCALVAGLARGLDKPLLMLAESDFTSPIDYRDMVYSYPSAAASVKRTHEWLIENLAQAHETIRSGQGHARALELAVELRQLRLGDPIAENEIDSLPDYFINTAAFDELLEGRTSLVVGRKGTGKTANLYVAASDLEQDARNLVVVIKPYAYEFEAVANLIHRYKGLGTQGYVIQGLWEFLILTDIAAAVYRQAIRGPELQPDSADGQFVTFMDANGALVGGDFATRLEAAANGLLGLQPDTELLADMREAVSRSLHYGTMRQLRNHLDAVLSKKSRVAVLVDNLDQAWSPGGLLEDLSRFLLGLLSSVDAIEARLSERRDATAPLRVTLAVLLRSDIFDYVRRLAPEPDKLRETRLLWSDREVLSSVIEARYAAGHASGVPSEFWTKFWCDRVSGVPTRDYILSRVLPRPRDLVFMCRSAISVAVNRRHARVEEPDIVQAENTYSQFAFEALRVENGVSFPELENVLYEFIGAPAGLSPSEVKLRVQRAGVANERIVEVVDRLLNLSFIGIVRDGQVEYSRDIGVGSLGVVLERGLREDESLSLRIHPAFYAYLGIKKM